jgi:histidinol-phosphate aminotransferase
MDRRRFIRVGGAGVAGTSGLLATAGPLMAHPTYGRWRDLALADRARSRAEDPQVRLSSNENPLGVCPAGREAIMAYIDEANRYPMGIRRELTTELAQYLGVSEDMIVFGTGSTEILQMAVQAFAGPRVPMIVAEPTFEDVTDYMIPHAYDLVKVPLDANWAHDIGRMREATEKTRRPAWVYICNPNNPTGTITPSAEIDAWIEDAPETTFFLIDEAYLEYVDDPRYRSAIEWTRTRPNVLVVRTFSKIFGMAGLRLGFAIAHPGTAARLTEFMCQNNNNVLASAAAIASLKDEDVVPTAIAANEEAKRITLECLKELDLEWLPTQTNFVMHRIHGDLSEYQARMRAEGWLVGRAFPPMLDHNRLSFGLPEDMARWAETLRGFRRKGWV